MRDAVKSLVLLLTPGRAEGSPGESRESLQPHINSLPRDISGRGKHPPEPRLDGVSPGQWSSCRRELRFLSHKQLLELLLALTFSVQLIKNLSLSHKPPLVIICFALLQ